mmetsp:Transcript_27850/g.83470  ORF Transcript_27850/g.83470 Transcript_27850/m.83470 type:complete len:537 (+) Transcript_27850:3-1613(+)
MRHPSLLMLFAAASRALRPPLRRASVRLAAAPVSSDGLPQRLQKLADDALRVARETGPRAAVSRTVQGQRAVLETLLELRGELPAPPPPATVLEAVRAGQQDLEKGGSGATAFAKPLLAWAEENVPPSLLPKVARSLCERLGATYVKLGQFVASSPTLFPAEYVREFEKTLDAVPPVAFESVKKVVEAELGKPLTSVYKTFDEEPLAAASVAQVHRATLKDGTDVVVKVLRPGVDDLLKADLGFLEVAGRALEAVAPEFSRVSLANVLTDLRATMLDELDLEKEAAALRTFREWVGTAGLGDVATAPAPYAEASATRVLTMDFLDGVALTDLDALRAMYGAQFDAEKTLLNALNTWSLSVLSCEFFHADVHAGNLLALPDGRVGFIDFGIVGRVPPSIWSALRDAGTAVAAEDYEMLAAALVQMGAADDVDRSAFAKDLEALIGSLEAVTPAVTLQDTGEGVAAAVAVDDAEITDVLLKLVELTERNGIKLPREFGLLVKQALYFDRYTKLLAPELDVLRDDRVQFTDDKSGAIDI